MNQIVTYLLFLSVAVSAMTQVNVSATVVDKERWLSGRELLISISLRK